MLLEQTSGMIPPRMNKKQKLELTWIGKENRPRLEPRILLEDPEKSYHAQQRVTDHDLFDNRPPSSSATIFTPSKRSNRSSPARSSASTLTRHTTPAAHSRITMTEWNTQFGFP